MSYSYVLCSIILLVASYHDHIFMRSFLLNILISVSSSNLMHYSFAHSIIQRAFEAITLSSVADGDS
jgi:hypothetical protein